MKHSDVEDRFQDLVDGTLSKTETAALLQDIASNEALSRSFESFKEILRIESDLSQERYELNENFVVKVMDALESQEQRSFIRRAIEMFTVNRRQVAGALTVCVVISLGVYVANRAPLSDLLPGQSGNVVEVATKPAPIAQSADSQVSKPPNAPAPQASSLVAPTTEAPLPPPPSEKKAGSPPTGVQSNAETSASSSLGTLDQTISEGGAAAKRTAPSVTLDRKQKVPTSAASGRSWPAEPSLENANKVADQYSMSTSRPLQSDRPVPSASEATDLEAQETDDNSNDASRVREASSDMLEGASQSPTTNPISTFSIDVDTGSYTNTRRALHEGHLPAPESVRVEEFLNYFDYNYPVQNSKPFALDYEIAPSPLSPKKYLLRLALAAKTAPRSEQPWNLVFLVDVSGSMSGSDRIDLLKRSLALLVAQMRPSDTVSIVTYAGSAGVLLDGGKGVEKSRILATIESLDTGGSTNGSGGIAAAYKTAMKHLIPGCTNRVILVTDGDFNVGTTSMKALTQLIAQQRDSGITLTTIGVGSDNFRDTMMEQLADVGNGNYFYLDSFTEARKIFETDLVGNIEVVAKDVKIQVEFNPRTVAQYRLIGYENRQLRREDFDDDRVDAGEIGSGHRVTALYELMLTDPPARSPSVRYGTPAPTTPVALEITDNTVNELAFLKLRFKLPRGDSSKLLEFALLRSHVKVSAEESSVDFRFAAAVSYLGELLRGGRNEADITFQNIAQLAAGSVGPDRYGYRREFVELVKNAGALRRK